MSSNFFKRDFVSDVSKAVAQHRHSLEAALNAFVKVHDRHVTAKTAFLSDFCTGGEGVFAARFTTVMSTAPRSPIRFSLSL